MKLTIRTALGVSVTLFALTISVDEGSINSGGEISNTLTQPD